MALMEWMVDHSFDYRELKYTYVALKLPQATSVGDCTVLTTSYSVAVLQLRYNRDFDVESENQKNTLRTLVEWERKRRQFL